MLTRAYLVLYQLYALIKINNVKIIKTKSEAEIKGVDSLNDGVKRTLEELIANGKKD